MVTREEVILAFKVILGRDPGGEKPIQNFMKCKDFKLLRKILLSSYEFSNKYKRLKAESLEVVLNKNDIDDEKIIFMHIPKTGGTTFHEILTSFFENPLICPERYNNLGAYTSGKLAEYRLFSGHFDYISTNLIPGNNKKIITFFRNPEERLISLYYFYNSHKLEFAFENSLKMPILANKYSFSDFFTCEELFRDKSIFNSYVYTLTGCEPSGEFTKVNGNIELNDHDRVILADAKSVVDSLFSFGVIENYDRSVEIILKKLNKPRITKIEKKMVLKDLIKTSSHKEVDRVPLLEEDKKNIEFNTYIDNFLYKYVVEKFNKIQMQHKRPVQLVWQD
ncbi:sulfotransferase family 2 domain-containing protein [bacterium]|nr:sulfotransferase family 2 domain-containing protein [bacterium]